MAGAVFRPGFVVQRICVFRQEGRGKGENFSVVTLFGAGFMI